MRLSLSIRQPKGILPKFICHFAERLLHVILGEKPQQIIDICQ